MEVGGEVGIGEVRGEAPTAAAPAATTATAMVVADEQAPAPTNRRWSKNQTARLIHAIGECKDNFLWRDERPPNGNQLEQVNVKWFWFELAKKFNDPDFNPVVHLLAQPLKPHHHPLPHTSLSLQAP